MSLVAPLACGRVDHDAILCGHHGRRLRVRAVTANLEVAGHILGSLSRHAGDIGAVARGQPSGRLDDTWFADPGVALGEIVGGQVRPVDGDVMGIGRVGGFAVLG